MSLLGELPDVVSEVLDLVRMRAELVCANEFVTPWALSFKQPVSHFHIIERGTAWLALDDRSRPMQLKPGDLIFLPLGAGHTLSSDPKLKARPIETIIPYYDGTIYRQPGKGKQTHIVCGRFTFAGVLAPRLLALLPKVIHLQPERGRAFEWLRLTSHFLVEETRNPRPGSATMVIRLLHLLFTQAVRESAAKRPSNLGWMSGLIDARIGRALSAIHGDPAKPWSVAVLADIAGLSRSAFADRFTQLVGSSPLRYLTAWRLDLAADYLRTGTCSIGEIAGIVGYGSEAALTRAFKARFGASPGTFRRRNGSIRS